ncbi:S1C family serine protease [Synechococcus sp. MIT S9451]|uniref:S1C family serine protease n=1 Tax=Synechococcus sp. MIT S9451 TaxID=3082543 RepID=UPI0039B636ED
MPSVAVIETADGIGSAFVVQQKEGNTHLLTNSHVVSGQKDVIVRWSNKSREKGIVIGDAMGNMADDIALIKVEGIRGAPIRLIPNEPIIGEDVFAIGAPRGLDFSLTRGVISQLRNDNKMVQIDVPVNPGNSGGPLINESGCVTGMVTSKLEENEGLNFAVSSQVLNSFLKKPYIARLSDEHEILKFKPYYPDTPSKPEALEESGEFVIYNRMDTKEGKNKDKIWCRIFSKKDPDCYENQQAESEKWYFDIGSKITVGDWIFVRHARSSGKYEPSADNSDLAINCSEALIAYYKVGYPSLYKTNKLLYDASYDVEDEKYFKREMPYAVARKMGRIWWLQSGQEVSYDLEKGEYLYFRKTRLRRVKETFLRIKNDENWCLYADKSSHKCTPEHRLENLKTWQGYLNTQEELTMHEQAKREMYGVGFSNLLTSLCTN